MGLNEKTKVFDLLKQSIFAAVRISRNNPELSETEVQRMVLEDLGLLEETK